MEETAEISPQQSRFDEIIILPQKGEFGERMRDIWGRFLTVRENGFYASDENRDIPRFNDKFAFHGVKEQYVKSEYKAVPPSLDVLRSVHTLGTISSFFLRDFDQFDLETIACADFYVPGKIENFPDLIKFHDHLIGNHSSHYTMDKDKKSVITIAYDTSRPELAPLLEYAMTSDQPAEELWIRQQQFLPTFHFPAPNMEHHLAVPVGLPANYIEYVIVNERSPQVTNEYLQQLQAVCVVDGHTVPIVSIHTGEVLS